MKVRVEIDENLEEEYIVIHCKKLDQNILRIQDALAESQPDSNVIILHKGRDAAGIFHENIKISHRKSESCFFNHEEYNSFEPD